MVTFTMTMVCRKKLSTRFWRCLGFEVKEKKPEPRRLQYGMMAAGGIFPVPQQLNLHPWFRSYHDKRRMAIPVPIVSLLVNKESLFIAMEFKIQNNIIIIID